MESTIGTDEAATSSFCSFITVICIALPCMSSIQVQLSLGAKKRSGVSPKSEAGQPPSNASACGRRPWEHPASGPELQRLVRRRGHIHLVLRKLNSLLL